MKTVVGTLLVFLILIITSACTGSNKIAIKDPWARPGFQGDNSAAYMVIDNATDQGDGLIGASSDVAMMTEVHLSKMDAEGNMSMERQDLVGIPAGDSVALEPGGLHVMLMNLVNDLQVGDRFELTLEFQRAGDITVEVEVRQP